MQCPKCEHPRGAGDTTCGGCGLVFHKYEAYLERQRELRENQTPPGPDRAERLKAFFQSLLVPPDTLYRYPALYALLWVGLVVWGWSYITQSLHQRSEEHTSELQSHS